ncbi:hypothetical protein NPIL_587821 [Nephila pilipes]|uniref:Uncharacterized protein n=1 Tax=Nephila pilipes TaxID=299642 RepID=A0A8X6QKK4_NEPPI|nr:hypothetical protein NPIL_587821 [Nephila pilipes]
MRGFGWNEESNQQISLHIVCHRFCDYNHSATTAKTTKYAPNLAGQRLSQDIERQQQTSRFPDMASFGDDFCMVKIIGRTLIDRWMHPDHSRNMENGGVLHLPPECAPLRHSLCASICSGPPLSTGRCLSISLQWWLLQICMVLPRIKSTKLRSASKD